MNVYEQALLVQDACNLSGVVLGFGRLMQELCDQMPKNVDRNEWLRTHPAFVLFLDKINDLARNNEYTAAQVERYKKAFDECLKQQQPETVNQ